MSIESMFLEFSKQPECIQEQRRLSTQLIQDVLAYCDKFESAMRYQNQKIMDELQACQSDNWSLQAQLENSETQTQWLVKENAAISSQNAYILVMIDGNGLQFCDQWIKRGAEGGKNAAEALRKAIVAQCGKHADVEIITKVVTNVDGLAKSSGRDVSGLRDFAFGFTQGRANFDFIDVGYGEGCLSSKITENIKFHLDNYNCRHILMGISHDASYATFLNKTSKDEFGRRRMTIIEGNHTVPELIATNIPTLDLGRELFSKDIHHSEKNPYTLTSGLWAAGPRPVKPVTSIASVGTPSRSSLSYADAASSGSPPAQISFPITPKPVTARASKAQNPNIVSPEQTDWNPGPRGLDKALTTSMSAMERIKNREGSEKLCNNHFLRGACTKGDLCLFVHDYKPSSEEIDAISVLARERPCKNGQDCEFEECIYGHHCPSVRDNICGHPFCKFAEDAHPPGVKFKNLNIKANQTK